MTDRLPHVREPSSGEPDICIYCREEWVDLLTLYETDECSVRLRAEIERLRGEVSLLQQEARIRRNISDGLAAEVAAERAAVVVWLRGGAGLRGGEPAEEWDDLWVAARDIEHGEHRCEGAE